MKKVIALLCSVLFILTVMFFTISAVENGYDGLYVVFGDSIAAGYGLDGSETGSDESIRYVADRDSDAYAGIVSRALNYDLNNFAASGATTANMLNTLKTNGILSAVSKAELVTVSIGGNDMIGMASTILPRAAMHEALGDFFDIPRTDDSIEQMYETLESNLTEIMQMLVKANNGKGKIYLQTLYNPFKYNKSYTIDFGSYTYNVGNLIDYYINRINEIYSKVMNNVGGFELVDTATALNGDERCFYEISTPDFHPTAFGHRVIANTILASYEKPAPTAKATTRSTTDVSSVYTENVGSTTIFATMATESAATSTLTISTTEATTEQTTSTTTASASTAEPTAPTTTASTAAAELTTERSTSEISTAVETTIADATVSSTKAEAISTVLPTTAEASTQASTTSTDKSKTSKGCSSAITGGTAIAVISAAVLCAFNFRKKER